MPTHPSEPWEDRRESLAEALEGLGPQTAGEAARIWGRTQQMTRRTLIRLARCGKARMSRDHHGRCRYTIQ